MAERGMSVKVVFVQDVAIRASGSSQLIHQSLTPTTDLSALRDLCCAAEVRRKQIEKID